MSQSSEVVKSSDTVAVRLPRALWQQIRMRALARQETGLSWLSRCATLCLSKVDGAVTAAEIEPTETGSVVEKNKGRGTARTPVADVIQELNKSTAREITRGRAEDLARPVDPTKPIQSPLTYGRRCACGHLETLHRNGKRCEYRGCDCRAFALAEDLA